jgi:hypothetical protein
MGLHTPLSSENYILVAAQLGRSTVQQLARQGMQAGLLGVAFWVMGLGFKSLKRTVGRGSLAGGSGTYSFRSRTQSRRRA